MEIDGRKDCFIHSTTSKYVHMFKSIISPKHDHFKTAFQLLLLLYREWIERSLLHAVSFSLHSFISIDLHRLNHRNKPTISKLWNYLCRHAIWWLLIAFIDCLLILIPLLNFPTRPPWNFATDWARHFSAVLGVFFLIRACVSNRGSGLNRTCRHSDRMVTSFSWLSSCLSDSPGAPTGVPAGAWDTHLKKWPHIDTSTHRHIDTSTHRQNFAQ